MKYKIVFFSTECFDHDDGIEVEIEIVKVYAEEREERFDTIADAVAFAEGECYDDFGHWEVFAYRIKAVAE